MSKNWIVISLYIEKQELRFFCDLFQLQWLQETLVGKLIHSLFTRLTVGGTTLVLLVLSSSC